jgi:REP element-mobilizing transposase RayT
VDVQATNKAEEGDLMANTSNSLAHTKWMCKYHIVFVPKYRRKIIYNQYKESIGEILRQLCGYKGVEIIEGHLMIESRTYVGQYTAQDQRIGLYGISEREKCPDDIR